MRKLIATITIVVALAGAGAAQASSEATALVTKIVGRQFAQQIRARAQVSGYKITNTGMKCASDGPEQWACYGTYVALVNGEHAKFGALINATPNGWKVVSNARYLGIVHA